MLTLRRSSLLAILFFGLTIAGCDQLTQGEAPLEPSVGSAELERLAAAEKATAETAAAAEKAAAENAKAEAEAKAKAEAEALAKKLDVCCQSLAQRGFAERSMDDMAAKKRCLKGAQEQVALGEIRGELTELLGERELPKSCLD